MKIVWFFPWLAVPAARTFGRFSIVPHGERIDVVGLSPEENVQVRDVLSAYRGRGSLPVRRWSLLTVDQQLFSGDDETVFDAIHSFHEHLKFSALCARDLTSDWGRNDYCNSDGFTLVGQGLAPGGSISVRSRRANGSREDLARRTDYHFGKAPHVAAPEDLEFCEPLHSAIEKARSVYSEKDWARWEHAIFAFNQANTDSDQIRHQIEWVLLAGAFEQLLDAKSEAKAAASAFAAVMPAASRHFRAGIAPSRAGIVEGQRPIEQWMREFYRLRGDFAHGKRGTEQRSLWTPFEHIYLAKLCFAQLVKNLLAANVALALSEEDRAMSTCLDAYVAQKELFPANESAVNQADNENEDQSLRWLIGDTFMTQMLDDCARSIASQQDDDRSQ